MRLPGKHSGSETGLVLCVAVCVVVAGEWGAVVLRGLSITLIEWCLGVFVVLGVMMKHHSAGRSESSAGNGRGHSVMMRSFVSVRGVMNVKLRKRYHRRTTG